MLRMSEMAGVLPVPRTNTLPCARGKVRHQLAYSLLGKFPHVICSKLTNRACFLEWNTLNTLVIQ